MDPLRAWTTHLKLTTAALALAALPAAAQEPAPSPTPAPPQIDVTGFVDLYYTYNSNGSIRPCAASTYSTTRSR